MTQIKETDPSLWVSNLGGSYIVNDAADRPDEKGNDAMFDSLAKIVAAMDAKEARTLKMLCDERLKELGEEVPVYVDEAPGGHPGAALAAPQRKRGKRDWVKQVTGITNDPPRNTYDVTGDWSSLTKMNDGEFGLMGVRDGDGEKRYIFFRKDTATYNQGIVLKNRTIVLAHAFVIAWGAWSDVASSLAAFLTLVEGDGGKAQSSAA